MESSQGIWEAGDFITSDSDSLLETSCSNTHAPPTVPGSSPQLLQLPWGLATLITCVVSASRPSLLPDLLSVEFI